MDEDDDLIRELRVENISVKIYRNRQSMGDAAAKAVAQRIARTISRKGQVSMVFAAAPSQEEFLASLAKTDGINWPKAIAFHLDEYIGLPSEAPQSFGRFLRDRLFNKVNIGEVCYIDGNAGDIESEARRYSELIEKRGLDIACLGIGENGHLAFNDPHVANFNDPLMVKTVELDEVSRAQQVHDGCFGSLDQVPKKALTLTMPTILNADQISVVVPASSKADAVKKTLHGPISTACPASILRKHKDVILYLDRNSAALI